MTFSPPPPASSPRVRYSYAAGDIIAAKFGTPFGATDRVVSVDYFDGKSDALCFVGVDGKLVIGELISWRPATDQELADWDAFGEPDDANGFADESEQKEVA